MTTESFPEPYKRFGQWWYPRTQPMTGETKPHGPFSSRDEAMTEMTMDASQVEHAMPWRPITTRDMQELIAARGRDSMSDDIVVRPSSTRPTEGVLVFIDEWSLYVPWDDIPDLITKLRRAYNSRPTKESQ